MGTPNVPSGLLWGTGGGIHISNTSVSKGGLRITPPDVDDASTLPIPMG